MDKLNQKGSKIAELIEKGREQGYLTYSDVNDHLPDDISDPDQVDEIIGMIKEYWVSKMIRMSYPLFIAMTALARMIIMQRKDVDPSAYVYESVAILILAIAIVVLRVRHMEILNRRSKKLPDD